MHPLLALSLLALLVACGESGELDTDQTSASQGGAGGSAAGSAGVQGGQGPGGSAGAAGAGAQGGSAGAGGAGGSGGGPPDKLCQGFQVTGKEIGLAAASGLSGVGTFDLARVGADRVFVLGLSEVTPQESLGYGQAASFSAGVWPAGDVGPFTKLDGVPLYDVALVPATGTSPVGLLLTITNSGFFSVASLDATTFQPTSLGEFGLGSDAMQASFVAQRPDGFLAAASTTVSIGNKTAHETYALLAKSDGPSVTSKAAIACAQGERALVSGFHREGETVVFAASEPGACKGDTPRLRLLSLADGDGSLSPKVTKEYPPPEGDLYEGVFAADAGGGSTWLISRQLGLNAEVQPPARVVRLAPDGSEAVSFDLPDEMLLTRPMAAASLAGNLLLALPDASIEGQGTIVVRLYNASGQIAGQTTVGTPLSAGGPFAFIDRVRLLPLNDDSLVVAYQARPAPGEPSTVRLAKITCFGED